MVYGVWRVFQWSILGEYSGRCLRWSRSPIANHPLHLDTRDGSISSGAHDPAEDLKYAQRLQEISSRLHEIEAYRSVGVLCTACESNHEQITCIYRASVCVYVTYTAQRRSASERDLARTWIH